ncbi:MAG: hypothetical protein V5A38_08515 [Halolamina sp.]|uniref:hypothetical protein n=1 Tax=Halolamina sp. TaxID=1940283 RepID=UPI002FC2C0E6
MLFRQRAPGVVAVADAYPMLRETSFRPLRVRKEGSIHPLLRWPAVVTGLLETLVVICG